MNQSAKLVAQVVVVLVATGLLGGYAYFEVFKKDTVAAQQKVKDERLFAPENAVIAADAGALKIDFTRLVVTSENETTVLERSTTTEWKIVSPVKSEVDALVIDALVSQLQQAKFKSTLDETPSDADLKTYGLLPPRFSVEATAGAKTVKLEGGIENTFDGSVYMRRDGQSAVYLAQGGVRWSLSKSTFDLRRKEVLWVDEAKLKALEVKAKNNAFRLERNEDKTWQVVKPFNAVADATTVAGLLGQLRGEKALGFVSGEGPARASMAEAVLTLADGKTVHLELGFDVATLDAGPARRGYVRREDENGVTVAEVTHNAVTALDRNPMELRDKTIVVFKKEAVTKVVFHNAQGEFSVSSTKSSEGMPTWELSGGGRAKTFKVTAVIWLVSTLKGSAFADEKPREADLPKYGLDAKARYIAMFDAEGAELARFSIGREVADKPGFFYVRGTRPQVIEVDGTRFTELPNAAADLVESPDAG